MVVSQASLHLHKRSTRAVHEWQRRRENGYICKGNFMGSSTRPRFHGILTTTTSFSSLYFVFIIMSEDIQNLLILHQMFIVQYDYTMILWKFPKHFICLIYSRRENVVETP